MVPIPRTGAVHRQTNENDCTPTQIPLNKLSTSEDSLLSLRRSKQVVSEIFNANAHTYFLGGQSSHGHDTEQGVLGCSRERLY